MLDAWCLMLAACCLMLAAWCLMLACCLLLDAWTPARPIHKGRRPSAASTKGGGLRPPPFVEPFVDGSGRCSSIKQQAASKHQASSSKHQAPSSKHWETGLWDSGKKLRNPVFPDSQFLIRKFLLYRGGCRPAKNGGRPLKFSRVNKV